jgi:predicted Fe-Mo cluster-binding NifX family protein
MKVSVVSSDGKVINQHFGKASSFLILRTCSKPVEATYFIQKVLKK